MGHVWCDCNWDYEAGEYKEGRTKTLKWCVIVVGVTQIGVIVKNTNGYVLSVVKRGN